MTTDLKLAHISDLHLSDPRGTRLRNLCNKRVLGYLSWTANRHREYIRPVLDAARRDILEQEADHVAVTGDLTQIGLPEEFVEVATWLEGFGAADGVTVIPGNHDAYVAAPYEDTLGLCAPWLEAGSSATEAPVFPTLRELGPIALIGVSSAIPTGPFIAAGAIGAEQAARLEELLTTTGAAGLIRVVLIHHPPVDGVVRPRKALRDAASFREVIGRAGAELVLHGHAHEVCRGEISTPNGPAPVIGVPATSAKGTKPHKRSRYNIYEFDIGEGTRALTMITRGWNAATGTFAEESRETIPLPAPR